MASSYESTLGQNAQLAEDWLSDLFSGGHSAADYYAEISGISDSSQVATLEQDEASNPYVIFNGLGPLSGPIDLITGAVTGLFQFGGQTGGQAITSGLGGFGQGLMQGAGPSQGSGGSLLLGGLAIAALAAIYLAVRT